MLVTQTVTSPSHSLLPPGLHVDPQLDHPLDVEEHEFLLRVSPFHVSWLPSSCYVLLHIFLPVGLHMAMGGSWRFVTL